MTAVLKASGKKPKEKRRVDNLLLVGMLLVLQVFVHNIGQIKGLT